MDPQICFRWNHHSEGRFSSCKASKPYIHRRPVGSQLFLVGPISNRESNHLRPRQLEETWMTIVGTPSLMDPMDTMVGWNIPPVDEIPNNLLGCVKHWTNWINYPTSTSERQDLWTINTRWWFQRFVHPENWGFFSPFDEQIFSDGWFNHQLDNSSKPFQCLVRKSRPCLWNLHWRLGPFDHQSPGAARAGVVGGDP